MRRALHRLVVAAAAAALALVSWVPAAQAASQETSWDPSTSEDAERWGHGSFRIRGPIEGRPGNVHLLSLGWVWTDDFGVYLADYRCPPGVNPSTDGSTASACTLLAETDPSALSVQLEPVGPLAMRTEGSFSLRNGGRSFHWRVRVYAAERTAQIRTEQRPDGTCWSSETLTSDDLRWHGRVAWFALSDPRLEVLSDSLGTLRAVHQVPCP